MADPGFVHLHVHSSYSLLEGAMTDRAARRARQGRPPAGAGADRHRQHVRRARILRQDGGLRHPADRRLCARGRFRRPGGAARGGPASAPTLPRLVLLAAHEDGYRNLMRLNSRAFLDTPPNEPPHVKLAWLEAMTDGLIALTGGPGGPLDRGDRGRARRRSPAARCEALARAVRRPALCRAAAPRPPAERADRAGADRARLCAAAFRSSPPTSRSSRPREDYEAHDALICIAEGRIVAEADRRQLTPEHCFKIARRDGGAVRRSARGARLDGRDRAALRLPAAHAQADPAALRRSATGAAVDEAAELRRAGRGGARAPPRRRTASRRAAPSRTTANGSPSSSTSSSG